MISAASIRAYVRDRPKAVTLAVAVLAILLIVAYWAYRAHAIREFRSAVVAIVNDSGKRLQDALNEPSADAGKRLNEHADTVTRHLANLRTMDGALDRPLSDAADGYVHTVREILKQRAASQNHREEASTRLRALWEHINERYAQGLSWTTEAIQRKADLETEYFYYKISSEAFAKLLESYSEERAKLAPFMDIAGLPDAGAANAARTRDAQSVKQLTAELDKLRQLPRNR